MKDELLDTILSAESRAEKIVEDAKKHSQDLITKSEIEYDEYKSQLLSDNKKLFQKELAKREKKLEDVLEKELSSYESKLATLDARAQKNADKAIKIILSEVTRL